MFSSPFFIISFYLLVLSPFLSLIFFHLLFYLLLYLPPLSLSNQSPVPQIGQAEDDSLLRERLEKQAVNQPAVLIYTSGTTGNPKGVILSQVGGIKNLSKNKFLFF